MSDPGFIFGQVPTAAQWNAAFAQKQDVLNYTPVNKAGDVLLGKLVTTASIAGTAGFAVLPGIAPSAPINGDIWITSTGMFAQINGSGVQLAAGSGVVNSGTAQQLAYYAASGAAISGNPNLKIFNGALTVGNPASIAGTIILSGLASGGVTLASAAAGGSGTITFPAGTVDFSSTGGTSQVIKQSSAGGIFTVGKLTLSDLSAGTTTGTGSIVLNTLPTFVTGITSPLVVGGTGASSTLVLESTSSGSPSGDSVQIRVNGVVGATFALNGAAPALVVGTSQTFISGVPFISYSNAGLGQASFRYDGVGLGVLIDQTSSGGPVLIDQQANSPMDFVTNNSTVAAGGGLRIQASGGISVGTITDPGTGAILANAAIKVQGTVGGLGYALGAGGTVGQLSSKSTTVALNAMSGAITMNNAALGSGAIVSFTFTNGAITATDLLILNHISGGTIGSYTLNAQAAAGSATITIRNNTGGSLSEALVIQFAVIKGSNS